MSVMRLNKQFADRKEFLNVLNNVDPSFFIYSTDTDHRHHKLSLENFEYIDFNFFSTDRNQVFFL